MEDLCIQGENHTVIHLQSDTVKKSMKTKKNKMFHCNCVTQIRIPRWARTHKITLTPTIKLHTNTIHSYTQMVYAVCYLHTHTHTHTHTQRKHIYSRLFIYSSANHCCCCCCCRPGCCFGAEMIEKRDYCCCCCCCLVPAEVAWTD